MKIYVDTNVYLDYIKKRRNKFGKDLSFPAFKIFTRTIACEFQIVTSDIVLEELYRNIELKYVAFLFEMLKHKIIKVRATPEDWRLARNLKSHDAIHVVIAQRTNALVITRNLRDFHGLTEAKLPEDV